MFNTNENINHLLQVQKLKHDVASLRKKCKGVSREGLKKAIKDLPLEQQVAVLTCYRAAKV